MLLCDTCKRRLDCPDDVFDFFSIGGILRDNGWTYRCSYYERVDECNRCFVNSCCYVLFSECDGKWWSIRVEYQDEQGNVVGWGDPLFSAANTSTLRRMVEMALSTIPDTDAHSCRKTDPLAGFEPEGGD